MHYIFVINSLSSEEVSYLSELELRKVYSTLVTFCEWIKDGVYDFCHLPWPMKAHLPAKVLDEVYDIYMQQGMHSRSIICVQTVFATFNAS